MHVCWIPCEERHRGPVPPQQWLAELDMFKDFSRGTASNTLCIRCCWCVFSCVAVFWYFPVFLFLGAPSVLFLVGGTKRRPIASLGDPQKEAQNPQVIPSTCRTFKKQMEGYPFGDQATYLTLSPSVSGFVFLLFAQASDAFFPIGLAHVHKGDEQHFGYGSK